MTITFKDPNGVECVLQVRMGSNPLPTRWRHAEPADLLSALGQLSTGSDGPSDEELLSIAIAAHDEVDDAAESLRASRRALYNAGLALGEQRLKAQGWRHVPDTHEVIPKGRHEWVLKSDLDAAKAEVDRLTALCAERHPESLRLNLRERLSAAESELAATKVKLAEVTEERGMYKAMLAANDKLADSAEELARVKDDFSAATSLYMATLQERDEARSKLAEVERARAGLLDEVGRAMRVVGSAQILISSAWLNGYHELRFDAQKWDALEAALNAFRTTTSYPPSDRTEPPRSEAGEPRCEHCNMREHAYSKGGRCPLGPSGRHSFDAQTEEPKPEPQPDAPLPLPWRLEFDGTLWSVMSADGQHVADDLREADAALIVARCNHALPPERQPEVERDNGSEQE